MSDSGSIAGGGCVNGVAGSDAEGFAEGYSGGVYRPTAPEPRRAERFGLPRKPAVCIILCSVGSFGCSLEVAGSADSLVLATGSVYASGAVLTQLRVLTDPAVECQSDIGESIATYRKAYSRYGGTLVYDMFYIV